MKNEKLLEVREFEKITCKSKDTIEYGDYQIADDRFSELEVFIKEFSNVDSETDVLEFMNISTKRNAGDVISLKNYVGLIQLSDQYQIQILPKISFEEEDSDNKKTKEVFLKMLRCLKDFEGKYFTNARLNAEKMNLYEVFINMYLQEVLLLVKRGIKSSYEEKEDNLNFYKGKLLVNKHIKSNIVHKEHFYVKYDEFTTNRSENKLIKATLVKLSKITTSAENSKTIKQLFNSFENVDISTNYDMDFSKVVINRNTKDYEKLMQWSKVFLKNNSFTTFSGTSDAKSILFPMESIYESFVAKYMKKVFSPDGWSVSTQDRAHYLFVLPNKQFALRPDIVIQKGNRLIVLDTKWKRLINKPSKNYGISQADMYQMYAYSKKYNTSEIWLLYPLNSDMKECKDIVFYSGDDTYVRLFFVDVANIEDSLNELKAKIYECLTL